MDTHLADFRESSVMICKLLNIPSLSLSTEVVLADLMLTDADRCSQLVIRCCYVQKSQMSRLCRDFAVSDVITSTNEHFWGSTTC